MAFTGRDIFYMLVLISAMWFLVLMVQLESCKDGLNSSGSGGGGGGAFLMKKIVEVKEREIHYLRERLKSLDPHAHVDNLPTIYIITPTYTRLVQKAELTRLATVFTSIHNVHWIVVEDAEEKSTLVADFLKNTGLNHTHLLSITPPEVKLKEKDPNWLKPRGVLQRNTGLAWIRDNLNEDYHKGVVYFADDDNTYSRQLFDEMRGTKAVSVWPVGLVGKLRYEAPIVKNGKVIDWHTYWYRGQRPFAMDMAGFAVNLRLILENSKANFDITTQRGYQESTFLQLLHITLDDLEPKADMCSKILVWHTRTETAVITNEEKMLQKGYEQSDLNVEV